MVLYIYTDGTIFYECMGCRKELTRPDGPTLDDLQVDEAVWDQMEAYAAGYNAGRGASSSTL